VNYWRDQLAPGSDWSLVPYLGVNLDESETPFLRVPAGSEPDTPILAGYCLAVSLRILAVPIRSLGTRAVMNMMKQNNGLHKFAVVSAVVCSPRIPGSHPSIPMDKCSYFGPSGSSYCKKRRRVSVCVRTAPPQSTVPPEFVRPSRTVRPCGPTGQPPL
jgi:hypothetical protein